MCETFGTKKVVCFIPCCGSKIDSGRIITPATYLNQDKLPNTWNDLSSGREKMNYCLVQGSKKTSALYLYTGSPYEVFTAQKDKIAALHQNSDLKLYIIYTGYGLLDALEPALKYDAVLQGRVSEHWREHNLSNNVADLLLQERPDRVYGFFAGISTWSHRAQNTDTSLPKG